MLAQPFIAWSAAGLMGGTGLYCLTRLRRTPPASAVCGAPLFHASEALMGLGAALMVVQNYVGGLIPPAAWVALYGVAGLFCLAVMALGPSRLSAGHRRRRLHDAISHVSMAYMGGGMAISDAHSTDGVRPSLMAHSHGVPQITGALLAYFCCCALWTGSRLLSGPAYDDGREPPDGRVLSGLRTARASSSAMSLGMVVSLLIM